MHVQSLLSAWVHSAIHFSAQQINFCSRLSVNNWSKNLWVRVSYTELFVSHMYRSSRLQVQFKWWQAVVWWEALQLTWETKHYCIARIGQWSFCIGYIISAVCKLFLSLITVLSQCSCDTSTTLSLWQNVAKYRRDELKSICRALEALSMI